MSALKKFFVTVLLFNLSEVKCSTLRTRRPGFDSCQGQGLLLFAIASKAALRPSQARMQWIRGALTTAVKRPGREVGHSLASSAQYVLHSVVLS